MATKATRITSTTTRTVTETVMVPQTVTREVEDTVEVPAAVLKLNFRNREVFNAVSDQSGLTALLDAMRRSGVSYTLRIKAVKVVKNPTNADQKALTRINNELIRLGKAANVPARKDTPSTPTNGCNDCTVCTS